MKDVRIIRMNLQESILVIDESASRIDSVIAIYSEHTDTVTIRHSFWNSNKEIESHFTKALDLKKAPIITSCCGFGVEAI